MIKPHISVQARVLQHALSINLVELKHAVGWAATQAGTDADPDDGLPDLARCQSTQQAVCILSQLAKGASTDAWWPQFKQQLASAVDTGSMQPQVAAQYCYNLALNGDIPAYDCEALYQFELEYDSLFAGHGTQDEVDAQVRRFFHQACAY